MSSVIAFVTSVYGDEYVPFLQAHLHSIFAHHPESPILVAWQAISTFHIDLAQLQFPHVHFYQTNFDISGKYDYRVSQKLNLWLEACRHFPDQPICFLDCDILLHKSIELYVPTDVDVVFTWIEQRWPLNTGVILVKNGQVGQTFIQEWLAQTNAILLEGGQVHKALMISGGVDQHSLRGMIGWVNYDRVIPVSIDGQVFLFKGVNCIELNEIRCTSITNKTHIIHYKAGWHPILFKRSAFTVNRPKDLCLEMFSYYNEQDRLSFFQHFGEALRHQALVEKDNAQAAVNTQKESWLLITLCRVMKIDTFVIIAPLDLPEATALSQYAVSEQYKVIHVMGASVNNTDIMARLKRQVSLGASSHRVMVMVQSTDGQVTVDLIQRLIAFFPTSLVTVVVSLMQDQDQETNMRTLLQEYFRRVIFSDEWFISTPEQESLAISSLGFIFPYRTEGKPAPLTHQQRFRQWAIKILIQPNLTKIVYRYLAKLSVLLYLIWFLGIL